MKVVVAMLRLKPWSRRGESHHLAFVGSWPTIHTFLTLSTYSLDEFSFKEMRTWGQSKISSCCLCVWCKSRELRGRESSRFPTPIVEIFSADLTSYKKLLGRVTFEIIYIASAKSWSGRGASHQPAFMDSCLTISHTRLVCLPSRWVSPGCSLKSYWTELHMEFCQTSTTELFCESMWSVFRWLG